MQWCSGSPDWHTPSSTNDLKEGGTFTTRMEAKDGSMGFDFGGTYTKVIEHEKIEYSMDDKRAVSITFEDHPSTGSGQGSTHVVEIFDAEEQNSVEMQQAGWQNIMDNFKKHTEEHHA